MIHRREKPDPERARKRDRPQHRVASLQLTSLLDLVFLLLIFFVLTSAYQVSEGVLPAEMPSGADSGPEPVSQPLVIELKSTGGDDLRIYLARMQTPIDPRELRWELQSLRYGSGGSRAVFMADDPVVIQADDAVRWEHIVNAVNAARHAGYKRVTFAPPVDLSGETLHD